jgi:hypothetical protein
MEVPKILAASGKNVFGICSILEMSSLAELIYENNITSYLLNIPCSLCLY